MRPTGQYAFNQMCGLLFGHLSIFSPGVALPKMDEISVDIPSDSGIIMDGYQFNLAGELLPIPPKFYIERYFLQQPHIFKDKRHDISFTINFMPWQDGGILLLRGKVPLQGFLIYLSSRIQKHSEVIRRGDLQISSVLPISQVDYLYLLQNIQHQTSFKLQKTEAKMIKQKFTDEGASSPFMARLFIGILNLRDTVFQTQSKRNEFDDIYHHIIMDLCSIKSTLHETIKLFTEHVDKATQGQIVHISGTSIHISENINRELRKHVESFIYSAARVLKNGMQNLAMLFNVNLGFLFQKESKFQTGIKMLEATNPKLASYI